MQATVHDLDGADADTVELPAIFETEYRPDLISRAVRVAQANRTQAYGADEFAGKRTSAESPGSGRGMAHVPQQGGRARRVPQAVGGRKAHPPKPEADRTESINTNERKLATRSAIAATADADRVAERGHEFDDDLDLPLVVDDEFEDLEKTREVVSFLEATGLDADIERADEGRSVRAGRGKTRGRKYKQPKSILFVTGSEAGPSRAARNLAGADVATAAEVNAEDLAPGAHPGRLTVWTEAALAEVSDR
ncbi:50S ribosomal protein L4P [Halovivax asiaticus JCM 14624]|uniref:Large ribosomal subunit protein uL4 n=1 Tax=Halovivax asiaticus JCM 14624 TaxID=1227490 RepID=M0BCF9_9EURY|nr:50S ribosomal protein L4 [Halovivax asiaticus]ELZ08596.1 50S ribosomal protein L4P [Halovivax asiaticus JCM 14624]